MQFTFYSNFCCIYLFLSRRKYKQKRYASMSLGYSDEIIKQMKNLKTIDSTDKILTHSIFSWLYTKQDTKI